MRGVIIDWGGVMTTPILDAVNAWLAADGIDPSSYLEVMGHWIQQAYGTDNDRSPVQALECGECADEEFEHALAERLTRLDGGLVEPAGLLNRMFAGAVPDSAMGNLVRGLRAAGVRIALLSNSWGRNFYPRDQFADLFDAVVISCEIGMRKPEERIFRHTAELLGLEPDECVFVDDIQANVIAAEAAGLIGVHHLGPQATARRLSELLGIQLGSA